MNKDLKHVKVGLALVVFGLLFGVIMGMTFGINEDIFKNYISEGIAANPTVHDPKAKTRFGAMHNAHIFTPQASLPSL